MSRPMDELAVKQQVENSSQIYVLHLMLLCSYYRNTFITPDEQLRASHFNPRRHGNVEKLKKQLFLRKVLSNDVRRHLSNSRPTKWLNQEFAPEFSNLTLIRQISVELASK